MKKLVGAVAALALCAGLLVGCAGGSSTAQETGAQGDAQDKIEVVCATFPAYDWTRAVVGDEADRYEISYLMGNGTDLHSYQPTVEDIAKIANCDLFVYVGGESDGWAKDAIETATNADLRSVNMMEVMGDKAVEEEVVEGMEADEHEHEHGEDEEHAEEEGEEHEHEEGEEVEYDEHVWLSLKNAQELVKAIATELEAIDADAAATYAANADAYCTKLGELDSRYAEAVAAGKYDTVVFADRFPFRYLVDDYDLTYFAAFVGCSAETEASFETVAFLAKKVDELGLGDVLVIEGSDQHIAQTVVDNTTAKDQKILVMDSLQSTSTEDVEGGKTYLATMEDNLAVLTDALS